MLTKCQHKNEKFINNALTFFGGDKLVVIFTVFAIGAEYFGNFEMPVFP